MAVNPVGVRLSSGKITLQLDPDRLAAYVADGGGPVIADLTRRANNVQLGARRQVGKRTRRLERSIVKRVGVDGKGPFVAVVSEGVPYGVWHHEGLYRGGHPNRFLTDNLPLGAR